VFVGHYSPSFAFAQTGRVPLWALFLAAQFVDILWSCLVLLGVERVRLIPGYTAASPLALDYMPYSHSLTATLAWALLLGGLASIVWGRRGGVAVGACVLAHWVLDLLVHVPDLPLVGDRYKVGFGLWNYPAGSFVLEAAVLLGAVALYVRGSRHPLPFYIFAVLMLIMQASSFVAPLPETPSAFAVMALVNYAFLAAIAGILERKWPPRRRALES
jgi:hypothetical protein